ncbi:MULTISPECIES: ABC transporter ATP-binding protein [unclassified Mesorhizobium]|jgi:branched-chain amino acid transport system ATP-binding protein|uniref:ABC transporter ATP-binding protein n=1 Tax=unclassified Mesorhizobium TaxID=325217 RepID=UPI0008E966E5|nr:MULTISPECIES: ABC transporter ATP-binding protein [unclassified Mesorhizobium]RJG44449.1 ABC transporter ATP-binding protein [Mesorhizobium sp. DCY119]SFT84460.1 amino acid/amide ABC transporter ATP-binding protein 1, HAAT family [Mesorhizobium sp. YR577]
MSATTLSLSSVQKSFAMVRVLEAIDLDIAKGERHALIGPNGAGKSTLFNLISGAFAPTSGSIQLNGASVAGLVPHKLNRAGLGRSFQITHVFDKLTVRENIRLAVMGRFGKRWSFLRRGAVWDEIDRETDALIAGANLSPQSETNAGDLAYSEQRAVEICMTVGTGAEVILLDEPTAGMSREETAHIITFIRKITEGRTLVMVEHDMDVVFNLADRVSVLVNGRILVTGTPAEIRSDARVREAYLGDGEH